ncbi:hypothetical protein H310_07199 [Aphanomyces invadans]|uniref:Expansin-like EG45 domain-containing protein n=1 Tax=Aphanomyces invadans TaxID=157072 RepID=A0A024U300_9STRA|nr:hypothetical protein H310_07199 [Aphanomyces invadans]ETW00629.1 hypothetical protein H310_07199 [Aphanomyces invadans]|eukprot:XP_008870764.1 hypothetical protein H310_07199 [Aphanomyces invadans]
MVMRRWLNFVTLLALGAPSESFSGDVTAYSDKWEGGNCGFNTIAGDGRTFFAALNAPQWGDKMECGRCVRVRCTSATCIGRPAITVLITDQCPECKVGDLDLSIQSFKALTGRDPARYKIEWDFVECPVEFVNGGVEFDVKDGSNAYWWALQPRNFAQAIRSVELKAQGRDWTMLANPSSNNIDSFYFLKKDSEGLPLGPCQIRTTSTMGEALVESFDHLPTSGTLYGASQFSRVSAPLATLPPESPNPTSNQLPKSPNLPSTNVPSSKDSPANSPSTPLSTIATTLPPKETPLAPATTAKATGLPLCNPSTASYELKQGDGGFALQVYITEGPPSKKATWVVDVTASTDTAGYITGISDPWNCDWSRTDMTLHLTPLPTRPSFEGPNHVGVIGTATNTVALASITLTTKGEAPCSIPPVVGTNPIGFAASEKATEGPSAGAILGIAAACVGLVAAVIMVIRVRHQSRANPNTPGFGGMLTPIDFAVTTPVAVL